MERLIAARTPRPLVALVALALLACQSGGDAVASASATTSSTDATTTTTSTTAGESSTSEGEGSTTVVIDPPAPKSWELSLELDVDRGAIFSLWADGPATIIAVGGQPTKGVVLEYKDDAWVADPTLVQPVPRLSWIHGIGDLRVAVGFFGVIATRSAGAWDVVKGPIDAPLWGVWGATADDLWVVGGSDVDTPPVLLHGDGEAWTPVDVSEVAGESHALYKIWGRAADDIFAIGARGLILHYDGAVWTREEAPTAATLIGLSGDDDEVVVAGGRASGVVLRRTPAGEWQALSFPEDEGFDGAVVEADGRASVVGRRGFIAAFAPESLSYAREESGVTHELHSVFAVPGGPVFAVGGHFDATPYTGVILRRQP